MELFQRMTHPDIDGGIRVAVGAVSSFEARGWVTAGDPATRSALDDEETVAAQQAAAAERAARAEVTVDAPVKAVLEQVGDDPVRARVALEAEQGKEQPRSTLVDPLAKVAAADEAGTTEGESDNG
jgi:hypothetical protein